MSLKFLRKLKGEISAVGTTIVFIFFGAGLVVTTIFALIEYEKKLQSQVEYLNTRLDQIQIGFIKSLSNSLWKLDDEQTKIILESIKRQQDIVQVKIFDKDKLLYRLGHSVESRFAINRTYPLVIEFDGVNKYLGDLEIIASKENMEKMLANEIEFSLYIELFKVLLFVLFTLVFIKVVITRHLDTITDFFKENNIYTSQKKLILNRGYEFWKSSEDNFDSLVSSINSMIEKLHIELQDRKAAEKKLTSINKELEKRVESKTRQLLETDRIEAVVEMSAGIAHEINSPLSVIYTLIKRMKKMSLENKLNNKDIDKYTLLLSKSTSRIFSITRALHMLSNISEKGEVNKFLLLDMVNETMEGIKEVFGASIGNINFDINSKEEFIFINNNDFYQLIYMLLHIRSAKLANLDRNSWINLEFSTSETEFIITGYDNAERFSDLEVQFLKDPFKSRAERDRGSLLILGTFASLINKLDAKINFIEHNRDIFLQIRLPFLRRSIDET